MVDLKENAASAYRRGSVLGFTIGEVFILLSFILLLILLLKQAEVFEKQEQVNALDEQLIYATFRLSQTEDTLQLVQARLVEAERRLEEAQVRNEQLASSVATWTEFTVAERDKIQELIASGELYSATAIASALEDMTNAELGNVIDQATRPGRQELLNALTEVSDEAMLNLAEAFEAVESPEDLASNVGEFGGVDPFTLTRGVTIARSIQELDPRISEEDVSDAIEVGTTINDSLSPSDWQRLESLLEATGWSPQALEQAYAIVQALDDDTEASLAAQVGAALEEAAQRTLTLASSLEDALGDVVESRGGRIDSRGTISFSDATLFPRGRADLTSEMQDFLDELCFPWLSSLRDQGFEIDEIRIEGHASPGWRGARNEQDAYLRNLELSQARARVVLEYCIDTTWGQDLGQWARERSVAIGFSSSRPVFENGEVSLEASQRVLLSATPDISDIMKEIEESVAPSGLSPSDEIKTETVAAQYDRSLFGDWADTDNDCQNTRHELLQELSTTQTIFAPNNCTVVRGKWYDPYSGKTLTEAQQVDVDHLVPLKWAWDRGAQSWPPEKRVSFSNDRANLTIVDRVLNREKGASGPLDWLPPLTGYRCQYVTRFLRVISTYQIAVPVAEREELVGLQEVVCK